MTNGIINVYKEAGYTSFDVVACLRKIFNQKRIGHTGTLDPDAVGVLPICLGNATSVVELLTDRSKEYVAEFILGVSTDTQDMTGSILEYNFDKASELDEDGIAEAIMSFEGEIEQIPPMYSALKVNGQKLVDLARKGIEVERKSRKVFIHNIEILESGRVSSNDIFSKIKNPEVLSDSVTNDGCLASDCNDKSGLHNSIRRYRIKVSCSKGTYIRTLIDDIGKKIGCGAAMSSLERTKSGEFTKEHAYTLDEIRRCKEDNILDELVTSVDVMFEKNTAFIINEKGMKALQNGNQLQSYMLVPYEKVNVNFGARQEKCDDADVLKNCIDNFVKACGGMDDYDVTKYYDFENGETIRVYDHTGEFRALYKYEKKRNFFSTVKMFL